MSDQQYHEKSEKEEEKREEKSSEEKNWDEKWQRDPLNALSWALIFIWAGVVFLANNLGWIDRWLTRTSDLPGFKFVGRLEIWAILLFGAGVIILVEVLLRLVFPIYRRPVGGSLFLAIFLIGVGLSTIYSWKIIWPLLLIALGLSVLLRGLFHHR